MGVGVIAQRAGKTGNIEYPLRGVPNDFDIFFPTFSTYLTSHIHVAKSGLVKSYICRGEG